MAAFLGRRYRGILGTGSALGQEGIILPSAAAPAPTYLLDFYTGAAAAYSVRRLSSSYSGSALRVRRSSDNAEQDIGFVGENLDTSTLTTFVGANDGFVVTWYDQSGNGNNATQITAGNQPKIVSSGSTITENSQPCVLFNGTSSTMTASYSIGNEVSIFNVTTHTNQPTANEVHWALCDGSSPYNRYELRADGAVYEHFIRESVGDGGSFTSESIETDGVNQNLFSSALISSTNYSWLNAVNKINGSATGLSMPDSTVISLGAVTTGSPVFFLDGNIQEFILYPSDELSNREAIETNINDYYNIYADAYNFNNALLTDGVDDYATPSSPITTSATEFVISLWFRSTVSGGGAATGFVATQSTESDQLVMANLDRVRIKLDGTSYDYNYSWSNDSDWHHYYWYRDSSGDLYLCIDGGAANLLSTGASGGITFDYLFRRGTSNTVNLNGTIDDFYLAETTGSAANAASVYNSGNGANPQTVHSNNGVVFYQFNESGSPVSTSVDSSGNGNDLTLTNFTGAYFLPHSYDIDTSVYLATAVITDTTEQAAVNQLVLDLKGTGSTPNGTDLWTDAAAFYPISPTSLSAAAYNLRDTTSFNMTWANSPTHASTGVTFDGSTQYGDTGFNPSTASLANSYDITLGVQIVNASDTAVGLLAANVSTTSRTQMLLVSGSIYQDTHNTGGRLITSTGGTYQGRMIISADRVANGGKANYLNGSSLGTLNAQDNGTPVNLSLYTGAQNTSGGGANFTAMELQFALIIPKGIDATAVADLDDAIARYSQTVLEGTLEAETLTYIEDAGITDRGEIAAVNQLVKDLKGTGSTTNNTDVWSDMNAIYPVSPTSLDAAKYNLKDTTSYNITWANSPTHSADGVVGNGSTQYGDTGFNINTDAALDSFGLTVYLNTYNALTSVEIGAYDTAFSQITGYAGGNTLSFLNQAGSGPVSTAGSAAVLTSVRTASNAIALYKNGVSVSTATTASTSKPNGDVYVLARNNIGVGAANLSTKRMAFAAIHAGLTANQAQDLYDAITTYNTALSR